MKLRSLEAFCAAIEEKSISGAARRMYLSQPSISERLAELEREAGVPLLRRSRLGVEVTREGAVLYKRARKLLEEARTLEATIHNLRNKDDMRLRFASCVTVGDRLLPDCLWQFRKRMPEVVPMVLMGNDSTVLSIIKSGEAPMGIVAGEDYYDDFDCAHIVDDELVVTVGAEHPWAHRSIGLEELSTEAFIAREKGSAIRELIEHTLADMGGRKLNTQMELGSTTAIKEVIEEGWAFSIFSRADIQRKVESGTLVEVEGFSIPWSFKLIRHPSALLTVAEQSFYDFLLEMSRKNFSPLRDKASGTRVWPTLSGL